MAAYRGWTQLQFAARLGMGRVALNDRWLGRTPWTLDETERAAHVFRVRLADLCTARDSNPEPSDSCPVVSLADVVVLDERRRAA